ncbi:MAG: putative kinase, partial [Candidatus Omnitrophota bacterium]
FEDARDLATEYMELREENEEIAGKFIQVEKTYQEIHQLAETLAEEGGDREAVIQKVRKHLNRMFDLELEMAKEELEMLEAEMERYEDEIAERVEEREAIIEEELQDLIEEFEGEEDDDEEEEEDGDEEEDDDEEEGGDDR